MYDRLNAPALAGAFALAALVVALLFALPLQLQMGRMHPLGSACGMGMGAGMGMWMLLGAAVWIAGAAAIAGGVVAVTYNALIRSGKQS